MTPIMGYHVLAADSAIPMWGQYGAVGVLLALGWLLWRYFTKEVSDARKEAHSVWERLATVVLPVLGRAVSSAEASAAVTERAVAMLDRSNQIITSTRDARDTAELALLQERLRSATLRADLAEERARGHGGT